MENNDDVLFKLKVLGVPIHLCVDMHNHVYVTSVNESDSESPTFTEVKLLLSEMCKILGYIISEQSVEYNVDRLIDFIKENNNVINSITFVSRDYPSLQRIYLAYDAGNDPILLVAYEHVELSYIVSNVNGIIINSDKPLDNIQNFSYGSMEFIVDVLVEELKSGVVELDKELLELIETSKYLPYIINGIRHITILDTSREYPIINTIIKRLNNGLN